MAVILDRMSYVRDERLLEYIEDETVRSDAAEILTGAILLMRVFGPEDWSLEDGEIFDAD